MADTTSMDLAKRLETVERSVRRWRLAAAAGALVIVGLVGAGQAHTGEPGAKAGGRTLVGLSVTREKEGPETIYRLWSDGAVERRTNPVFDFRGNERWDLMRWP